MEPGQDTSSTCPNCHCHPNPTPPHFLQMPQCPFHSRDSQAGKLATSHAQRSAQTPAKGFLPLPFLMCKPSWDTPQNPVPIQSSLLPDPITIVGS